MKQFILITYLFVLSISTLANSDCPTCPSTPNPGPTLQLGYAPNAQGNAVESFMYFVPLVAPSKVTVFTDPNTSLSAQIVSHHLSRKKGVVSARCEFIVNGVGLYEALLDVQDMIAFNTAYTKAPNSMQNVLESIRIENAFRGRVDVLGKEVNGQLQVDEFHLRFDLGGKSPVSATVYDVPCIDNTYSTSNIIRTQRIRVNAMKFTVSPGKPPLMEVEVGAISSIGKKDTLLSSLKAFLANWFLPEIPIPSLGGSTMADFGTALANKEEAFTFPLAQNLRLSLSAWVQQQSANGAISN